MMLSHYLHTTLSWNNLHQVRSYSQTIGRSNNLNISWSNKLRFWEQENQKGPKQDIQYKLRLHLRDSFCLWCLTQHSTTFQLFVAISFIGWGNRITRSHWLTLSHNFASSTPLPWTGFEITTLVVIGTDCTGSYKSNKHTITIRYVWGRLPIVLIDYTMKQVYYMNANIIVITPLFYDYYQNVIAWYYYQY